MKINAFDINRFGVWDALKMPHLSEGLNVIYGPNEAGKTTLLEFIRTMLYGFGDERVRYVRPRRLEYGGGAVILGEGANNSSGNLASNLANQQLGRGGEMVLCGPNGVYHIRRSYHIDRIGHEEATEVTGRDGVLRGEHFLRILATGIDEATFNNVFAVGLDEIQRLATLGDADAADALFRLSIGLDRVSLMSVLREMRQTRLNLVDPNGKTALIARQIKRRRELLVEVRTAELALRDYARLRGDRSDLDRIIASLENELAERQRQATLYETLIRVAPIFDRREELKAAVTGYGDVTEISDAVVKQVATLEESIKAQKPRLEAMGEKRRELRKQRAGLAVSKSFARLLPRLEAILEEERRLISLDEQIQVLQAEIAPLEQKLRESSGQNVAGIIAGDVGSNADYKQLARTQNKTQRRYRQAKRQLTEAQGTAERLEKTIRDELARRNVSDIGEAINIVSEETQNRRRRQVVTQRLAELAPFYRDAVATNQHLIVNQSLPLWMLGGLGVLGMAGIVLVGLTLAGQLEAIYAILGLIGVGCGVATKIVIERSNATKLANSQRQLKTLLGQIDQGQKEVAAIDSRYPLSGETPEGRLVRLEQEIVALEGLIPVDAQRRDAATRREEVAERCQRAKRIAVKSKRRWVALLEAAGLPIDWDARRVADFSRHDRAASEWQREIEHRQVMLAQRRDERRSITDRIDVAVIDAALTLPAGAGLLDALASMRQRIEGHRLLLTQRKKYRREEHVLMRSRRKVLGEMAAIRRKIEQILFPLAVNTPAVLRNKYQHYLNFNSLVRERDAVVRELTAGLGGVCDEASAVPLLTPEKRSTLAPQRVVLLRAVESVSHKLHDNLQQRGRLDEQIERLVSDETPRQRLREVAILDERIRDTIFQWQRAAVTGLMLDEIRQMYERERQPQTLFDTSHYLKQFTDGRYVRVWAPLGEETLYIDDRDGNTWDAAWLSRGTREQLFIALRLSLASSFSRHGSSLPIVLDDVLVNCDTNRAEAAADVLIELAREGQQIFLFTCHEHICRMFQSRRVPVFVLPSPDSDETTVRVLLASALTQALEEDVAEEEPTEEPIDETAGIPFA